MEYKCDICEKIFKSKNYLLKHSITRHMKTLTCKSCQLSYQHLSDNFNCKRCVEKGVLCKWCKRRLPAHSFTSSNKTSICNSCVRKNKENKRKKGWVQNVFLRKKIKIDTLNKIEDVILSEKDNLEAFLQKTLKKFYPDSIKYSIVIEVLMKRDNSLSMEAYSNPFFRIGPIFKHHNKIPIEYDDISSELNEKMANYTERGSGWAFVKVENIFIEAIRFKPFQIF